MERFRFPTPEEMQALERAARRARARQIGHLFASAARLLKERVRGTHAAPSASPRFPIRTERNAMTPSFWKDALASLPPSVQRRYATAFEAAERFEAVLDLGIEAWGAAKDALATLSRAAGQAMLGAARILDGASRRRLPTH